MEAIEWNESLSVNNTIIDTQHKELFEITNKLIANSNIDINSALVGETLRDLLKYTKCHFKEEEKLLEKYKYPRLEEHREMHIDFIYQTAMFCKGVMEGNTGVTKKMIHYLVNWLLNHTSIEDLDFKNYISELENG